MTFSTRFQQIAQSLFTSALNQPRRRTTPAYATEQVEQRTLLAGTPFPWDTNEVLIGNTGGDQNSADDVIGNAFNQNQVFFTQTANTPSQAIVRVTLTRDANGQITGATTDYTSISTLEHNSQGLKALAQFNADTLFYTLEEGDDDTDGLIGRMTNLANTPTPAAHATAADLTDRRTGGVSDFDPEGITIDRVNNFLCVMTDDGPNTDVAQYSINPTTLELTFNWVKTVETGGTNGNDGTILPDGRVALVSGTTSVNIFAVSQDGNTVTNLLGGATSGAGRDTPQDLLVYDGNLYLAWESGIIDAFDLSNPSTTPTATLNLDTLITNGVSIGGLGLTNDGHLLVGTRAAGGSDGEVYAFNLPVPPVNVITVDTFNDVVNAGDGLTSLREAIIAANTTAGDDEIVLQAGTYTLTRTGANENAASTGDLDILNNGTLAITGQGAGQTTINATGLSDRVFHVHTGATFTLDSTTVTGGNATGATGEGGGLLNDSGDVTITDSVFNNNRAGFRGGALTNTGTGIVAITNSTLSNNLATSQGGGLYNYSGEVSLTDSTVNNNTSSSRGGGLANQTGILNVTSSTINANKGTQGAGFYISAGQVNIVNSTISGNQATSHGGGLQNVSGTVSIQHSTIIRNKIGSSGQGGGIDTGNNLTTLRNTIVAGNLKGSAVNDIRGTLVATSAYNLVTSSSTRGGLTHNVNGNIVGVNGSGTRNLATVASATLANNGGPTQTHLLVTGSVALDAGDPAFVPPPDTDQRGIDRVLNTRIDIGAVEGTGVLPD